MAPTPPNYPTVDSVTRIATQLLDLWAIEFASDAVISAEHEKKEGFERAGLAVDGPKVKDCLSRAITPTDKKDCHARNQVISNSTSNTTTFFSEHFVQASVNVMHTGALNLSEHQKYVDELHTETQLHQDQSTERDNYLRTFTTHFDTAVAALHQFRDERLNKKPSKNTLGVKKAEAYIIPCRKVTTSLMRPVAILQTGRLAEDISGKAKELTTRIENGCCKIDLRADALGLARRSIDQPSDAEPLLGEFPNIERRSPGGAIFGGLPFAAGYSSRSSTSDSSNSTDNTNQQQENPTSTSGFLPLLILPGIILLIVCLSALTAIEQNRNQYAPTARRRQYKSTHRTWFGSMLRNSDNNNTRHSCDISYRRPTAADRRELRALRRQEIPGSLHWYVDQVGKANRRKKEAAERNAARELAESRARTGSQGSGTAAPSFVSGDTLVENAERR